MPQCSLPALPVKLHHFAIIILGQQTVQHVSS